MSLAEGYEPHTWNEGNITPFIYIKNRKTEAGNYRSVSLTSVLCKVMESFARDYLVDHMMKNRLFCEAQHGYVPGRSCMTQLLITLEFWTEILDSGVSFDCIYIYIYILTLRRLSSPLKTTVKSGRLWYKRTTQCMDQQFSTREETATGSK